LKYSSDFNIIFVLYIGGTNLVLIEKLVIVLSKFVLIE